MVDTEIVWAKEQDKINFLRDILGNLNKRMLAAEENMEENGRQTSITADYLESIRYGLVKIGRFIKNPFLGNKLRRNIII